MTVWITNTWQDVTVSFHTSAREVTGMEDHGAADEAGFNPHFRKGSDKMPFAKIGGKKLFQSTLPQGK